MRIAVGGTWVWACARACRTAAGVHARPLSGQLPLMRDTVRRRAPCSVLAAEVHGLEPAQHDATLFPSDHAAVKATIRVTRQQAAATGGLRVEDQARQAGGA